MEIAYDLFGVEKITENLESKVLTRNKGSKGHFSNLMFYPNSFYGTPNTDDSEALVQPCL
jgi:hypothetical protein